MALALVPLQFFTELPPMIVASAMIFPKIQWLVQEGRLVDVSRAAQPWKGFYLCEKGLCDSNVLHDPYTIIRLI